MGEKKCANHPKSVAAAECTQCRKPICPSCTMVTPMGRFCSSECSMIHRETKTKVRAGEPSGGGALKAILFFILLFVLAAVLIHTFRGKNPTLNKLDIVGRLLGDKGVKPASDTERPKPATP